MSGHVERRGEDARDGRGGFAPSVKVRGPSVEGEAKNEKSDRV